MKILLPISIILLFALGFIFFQNRNFYSPSKSRTQSSPQITKTSKTFKSSSIMKFSIDIPENYETEEKLGAVTIKTNSGEIHIDQNGTNYENLKNYVNNSQNNLKERLKSPEWMTINGLESVKGSIDNEKLYIIFSKENATVYIISTKDDSLYSALDQIAQSFRYTP